MFTFSLFYIFTFLHFTIDPYYTTFGGGGIGCNYGGGGGFTGGHGGVGGERFGGGGGSFRVNGKM